MEKREYKDETERESVMQAGIDDGLVFVEYHTDPISVDYSGDKPVQVPKRHYVVFKTSQEVEQFRPSDRGISPMMRIAELEERVKALESA